VTDPAVSQRELSILKADADREHAELSRRLAELDAQGSRGVVELRVQMSDALSQMADMRRQVKAARKEMRKEFRAHLQVHEADERRRVAARRWLVGSVIAAIAAIDGPLVALWLARGGR